MLRGEASSSTEASAGCVPRICSTMRRQAEKSTPGSGPGSGLLGSCASAPGCCRGPRGVGVGPTESGGRETAGGREDGGAGSRAEDGVNEGRSTGGENEGRVPGGVNEGRSAGGENEGRAPGGVNEGRDGCGAEGGAGVRSDGDEDGGGAGRSGTEGAGDEAGAVDGAGLADGKTGRITLLAPSGAGLRGEGGPGLGCPLLAPSLAGRCCGSATGGARVGSTEAAGAEASTGAAGAAGANGTARAVAPTMCAAWIEVAEACGPGAEDRKSVV